MPESPHAGHRKRLKERFLREGLDGFEPHTVLELLLFYALPQRDTNVLAHRLMTRFGTLDGVFDAPFDQLLEVEGMGENAASLIKLIPHLARRYLMRPEREIILNTADKMGRYLLPYYIGCKNEQVYALCLDSKFRLITVCKLFEGGIDSTNINVRKVVEAAIKNDAYGIVLSHNHPNGLAIPSNSDVIATQVLQEMLSKVGITLIDHIIIGNGDFVSIKDSAAYNYIFARG